MNKVIILIPVYNDWDSLNKLLDEINQNIKSINGFTFECFIVNDASTIKKPLLSKPSNINSLKILNMKENRGHARCNAFGIRYIYQNEKFNYLILMDGDGEDRPEELKKLIYEIIKKPNNSVVAKRIKRSEGPFFRFLYFMHKLITLVFTGKNINFGNYSCLTKNDVGEIYSRQSLWSSYSGTVKKYVKEFSEIESIRGNRYYGPSKMSLYKLLIHSFSIVAVFKVNVLIRSTLFLLAVIYFNNSLGLISNLLKIAICSFCIVILIVSLRENKRGLINSQENLRNIEDL
tara:strand:- start:1228 stop:2094 length:867 start_codon:yes stop_codon:yes gene_type:complete